MTQCCYKTHRKDPAPFQKSMRYQHLNCFMGIRKEGPNYIPMLRGLLCYYFDIALPIEKGKFAILTLEVSNKYKIVKICWFCTYIGL